MIPSDRWQVKQANADTERVHLNRILESIAAAFPDVFVESIAAGTGIVVDDTDPANPEVSVDPTLITEIGTALQPGDNVSELVNDAGYTSNVGTVTSVDIADATGIDFTGGPITGSGSFTPALSANLQAWHALATSSKQDASANLDSVSAGLTAFGLSLIDDVDDVAGRATLGAASAADVASAGVAEAFGVVLTDLNVTVTTEPMFFSYANTAANIPSSNPGGGIHIPVSATAAIQIVQTGSGNVRNFIRSASGGAWNAWVELGGRSPRISASASGNITPAWDNVNIIERTAQAAAITINDASSHAQDGELVGFRLKATGADRAITWNAAYRAMTTALPANVINGKTLWVWFRRNTATSTYDIDSVQLQP